ncbi:MAG: hypothetical protein F4Y71_01885 [Acidobacteria bacterium]|nr:hypothetical protein [Acidobacteriota bacterium]MXW72217.1 hypothetical protein [Acidobacteriota bacterium]MXX85190.1 hypothetical protein [Acidobacteriota bacterium]MYE43320.1 hypothetical protein [Acidobacteriota bacterium]MYF77729.1 hypothetical protein [Acidobacteriota bacterium]
MVNRILVGAGTLIGLAMGFAPGTVPMDGLLMVLIGIVYFVMNVDAEDPTVALVMAIAVGGMTASDVLHHIPAVGMAIDGAFEALAIALWAGVATVAATRILNRVKG